MSRQPIIFTLILLLSACGGSGSDDNENNSSSGNTLEITKDNSDQIAAFISESIETQSAMSSSSSSLANEDESRAAFQANRMHALITQNQSVNYTFNCTSSGTLDVELTTSVSQESGETNFSGILLMHDCVNESDYQFSGSFTETGSFNTSLTANLKLEGEMTLTEISSSQTLELTEYQSTSTITTSDYSISVQFQAGGSLIDNKTFTLTTLEAITGSTAAEFPTGGTLHIQGAAGNTMTIRMDESGSGIWIAVNGGQETFKSWEELLAM